MCWCCGRPGARVGSSCSACFALAASPKGCCTGAGFGIRRYGARWSAFTAKWNAHCSIVDGKASHNSSGWMSFAGNTIRCVPIRRWGGNATPASVWRPSPRAYDAQPPHSQVSGGHAGAAPGWRRKDQRLRKDLEHRPGTAPGAGATAATGGSGAGVSTAAPWGAGLVQNSTGKDVSRQTGKYVLGLDRHQRERRKTQIWIAVSVRARNPISPTIFTKTRPVYIYLTHPTPALTYTISATN